MILNIGYLNCLILSNEVKILILGAVIGSILTFVFSQLEKKLDKRKGKRKAIMCLKIELKRIDKYLKSLSNSEKSLNSNLLPDSDIPELDLSTQSNQFMYYDYELAEKVYELVNCLSSANKRRNVANGLIKKQTEPEFLMNAGMFRNEVVEAKRIIEEIKAIVNILK